MRSGKKYRQRTQQQSVSQSHVNILARQRFLFPLPPSSWKSNDISSAIQFSFESPGHPTELAYTHTDTKNPADELLLSVPSCKIEKTGRRRRRRRRWGKIRLAPVPTLSARIYIFSASSRLARSLLQSRACIYPRGRPKPVYIYIYVYTSRDLLSLSPSLSRSLALSLSLSLPLVGFTIRHGVEG